MKRFIGILIFTFVGFTAFSQQAITLREAIVSSAEKIEQEVGSGKKVAIYDFLSTSPQLSTYVIDELMDVFINHKILTIAERNRLAVVRTEADYQFGSGEVDDNEIIDIAHGRGIDFVITGQLDYDGINWRFRIYAIDTNKRIRVASSSLYIRSNDRQLNYFLGGAAPPSKNTVAGNSTDDWRNKWIYLGGCIGFGGWERSEEDYNYDYGYYESETYTGSLIAAGFVADFSLLSFFSIEIMLGAGYDFYSVYPVVPILARLGYKFSAFEISGDVGYTIGVGFTFGGTLGFNLGKGVLFAKFITMPDNQVNDSISFGILGYKVGLVNK
jgi:hypothetical protein